MRLQNSSPSSPPDGPQRSHRELIAPVLAANVPGCTRADRAASIGLAIRRDGHVESRSSRGLRMTEERRSGRSGAALPVLGRVAAVLGAISSAAGIVADLSSPFSWLSYPPGRWAPHSGWSVSPWAPAGSGWGRSSSRRQPSSWRIWKSETRRQERPHQRFRYVRRRATRHGYPRAERLPSLPPNGLHREPFILSTSSSLRSPSTCTCSWLALSRSRSACTLASCSFRRTRSFS